MPPICVAVGSGVIALCGAGRTEEVCPAGRFDKREEGG